jgi:energy-coupling factor transporter ATP-binding protein EcfA2
VSLILGPSGAGKSTLGLVLNGVVPRLVEAEVTGSLGVGGLPLDHGDPASRGIVGCVFQDPESQFCMLHAREEVAFGPENLRVAPTEIARRVEDSLARVALSGFERRNIYRLSGGEKQRLAVASVLALAPRVFFFDSPTANLDPVGASQVYAVLRALKGQYPIFLVEQKLDDVIDMVDQVVLLGEDGTIQAIEEPARLFVPANQASLDKAGVWIPEVVEAYWNLPGPIQPAGPPLSIEAAADMIRPHYRNLPVASRNEPSNSAVPQAVAVSDLSFRFSDGTAALDHVDLSVPEGGFYALVGQNGSGKTTLAHHLVGIRRPPAGTIRLFGDDMASLPLTTITRQVGFVFQNPEHQFVSQTVRDEIQYGPTRAGRSSEETSRVAADLIERFALAPFAYANPFTLSAGQMRRLSVATVLAVGPRVLVLDEPTFGQDRASAAAIMSLLADLNRSGNTIIMVTHDMRLVADYATHVAVMAGGRVTFQGRPRDLFADEAVLERASLRPPAVWRLSALLDPLDSQPRALRMTDLLARVTSENGRA